MILYQMLTSRFPYEVIGNMRDVLDRIMKSEPARPSTMRRQINDEVETIVLKCLQKDRERRYQTAGELARDVRHYLAGEPIEAKRESTMYLLRKTLRRYRLPVGLAVGVVLLLAGSSIALSVMYRNQSLARRAAVAERDKAAKIALPFRGASSSHLLCRWYMTRYARARAVALPRCAVFFKSFDSTPSSVPNHA